MAQEMMAYVDGEFVPDSKAKIGIFNAFNMGYGVYEFSRTFKGKLFKYEEHLDRLYASAWAAGLDVGKSREELKALAAELLARNAPMLEKNEDVTVLQRISQSGTPSDFRVMGNFRPSLVMCIFRMGFSTYARFYRKGVHLVVPTTRRNSPHAVDSRIKDMSRMNVMLALRETKAIDPEAFALLFDLEGYVAESTGANFFLVKDGRLVMPKPLNCLGGISRLMVLELAAELGIPVEERDIAPFDVLTADEAFLTSTSVSCLPASRFNFRQIGDGEIPGPVTKRLLNLWGEKVGLDIIGQALSYLEEGAAVRA
ncbi:MAG: aminotransferase class IV [Candidatus Sumerlaeota bacterium]|nr:aminotransferase class IV [Candidatus Sumerlaeota bacterium]